MMYWNNLLTRFLKSALCTPVYCYAYGVTTGLADRALGAGGCPEQWWLKLGVLGSISGNCWLFPFCLITSEMSLFTIEASELIDHVFCLDSAND